MTASRLPCISPASSLSYREARYARAESTLRVALSRCENEPSALELQVRVLEKGLQAWNLRAGRGYERVQKAEEALAAARRNEEGSLARGSFSELQREKWMAIKERDEGLTMVDKIKGLIKELNMEIMEGLKVSPKSISVHSAPQKASETIEGPTPCDTTVSKKVAILFSGKLPVPYLENLPRSRRSVEPLRLPLHITTHQGRRRSSTLNSEHSSSIMSSTSCTTQPPTPHPATPTDDFGAAFIHTPIPLKSVAQYLAEMEETRNTGPGHRHVRLPSYVETLLDELGEDRIGDESLHISKLLRPSIHCPSPSSKSPISRLTNQNLKSKGSKGVLGRSFSNLPSVPFPSSSQHPRSKENHPPSISPYENSTTAPEKALQTFSNKTRGASPSSSPPSSSPSISPTSDTILRKQQIKSSGRVGNLMESVKRGVKKVSRRGE